MAEPTIADLFAYVSRFYQATDTKLNSLSQSVVMLKNHMTRLYALHGDALEKCAPATGHLKLKQDGCLRLLEILDGIFRDAGIKYMLGYGTLLGAARGGTFIPWDDDIDLCLMRDDFNRAVAVLSEKFADGTVDKGIFTSWGMSGGIFKVLVTPRVCIDLFPWDYYYTRMQTDAQRDAFTNDYGRAMETARQMEADKNLLETNPDAVVQSTYTDYPTIINDMIMHDNAPDVANGDVFEGIDWQTFPERAVHFFHNKPFRHEWVFPFGEIEFCGKKFPAPNNVDAVLTTRFGDWGEFRPDFARHASPAFTYEELVRVREFLGIETK